MVAKNSEKPLLDQSSQVALRNPPFDGIEYVFMSGGDTYAKYCG